jgi:hypothetical protein
MQEFNGTYAAKSLSFNIIFCLSLQHCLELTFLSQTGKNKNQTVKNIRLLFLKRKKRNMQEVKEKEIRAA